MAHANIQRRIPGLMLGPLADQLRPGQGRERGGTVRPAPTRRTPHSTREQRAPLHQLTSALCFQVMLPYRTDYTSYYFNDFINAGYE